MPKIGFGTWKIGGESHADPSSDPASLRALQSALELGYIHFDTAEVYADGHTEELLGAAIREVGVPRESLFITSKVSPEHLKYEQVLHSCEKSLERLGMEYLDLYLIHWPKPRMDLKESFRALNQLVRQGKVRHLGVSNFKLKHLKEAVAQSETALLTNQVPYSVPERTYQTNGVLAYCQANDILLTAYSPVKRRNIKNNPALKRIATAPWAKSTTSCTRLAHLPGTCYHHSNVHEPPTPGREFAGRRDCLKGGRNGAVRVSRNNCLLAKYYVLYYTTFQ